MKIERYKGNTLSGNILVTYKIDGVRLHVENGEYRSRAGKPLYNLPKGLKDGVYEIFRENFKKTIEVVRSSVTKKKAITKDEIFRLDDIDPRLVVTCINEPSKDTVDFYMKKAVREGYEGLVLREENTGRMYKVKTEYWEQLTKSVFFLIKSQYWAK